MLPNRLTYFIDTMFSFRAKILNKNVGNAASLIFRHLDAVIVLLSLIGAIGCELFLDSWTIAVLVTLFSQSLFQALRWLIERYNHYKGGRNG